MTLIRPKLKSSHNYKQKDLITLISKDFLAFSLSHTLNGKIHEIILPNNIHVTLLDDGIIGFNIDKQSLEAKSIVLSCGVHGNETAPIEICNTLVSNILNLELTTNHRVLFIFANLDAMVIAERFVEENLNRLFNKDIMSTTSEGKLANNIMHTVDSFFESAKAEKIHYDLHTAIRPSKNEKFAVYPYLHGKQHSKEQLSFMSLCDVNTILLSQTATSTFSYYSSFNHNAHAFTVELGKVKPFGENEMSKFTPVMSALSELLSNTILLLPTFRDCPLEIYTVNQVINKHYDDFKLHFTDDIANFTIFDKGQILASETNTQYKAEYDGEAIVFPNADVAIGQRAILTVIPYEI